MIYNVYDNVIFDTTYNIYNIYSFGAKFSRFHTGNSTDQDQNP